MVRKKNVLTQYNENERITELIANIKFIENYSKDENGFVTETTTYTQNEHNNVKFQVVTFFFKGKGFVKKKI